VNSGSDLTLIGYAGVWCGVDIDPDSARLARLQHIASGDDFDHIVPDRNVSLPPSTRPTGWNGKLVEGFTAR
jgi:hypothetical protein